MNTQAHVEAVFNSVRDQYKNVKIDFESSSYWETLWFTYTRTVRDIVDLASSRFSGKEKIRILEIGSFCGVVATALKKSDPRFEVTAWDLPMFMEDKALKEHYREMGITAASGNLASLPLGFENDSFDIIICCEVIEHLNFNPLPVFCEFNRLLKLDGLLYIGTPNHSNIVKRLMMFRGKSIHDPVRHLVWQLNPTAAFSIGLHWREYTAGELVEMMQLTGFNHLKSYYCHTNERSVSSGARRAMVSLMYGCFPAFLPSQVAIGAKRANCDVKSLREIK
jgi:2-polyprenyl-3-methyl-5-hydroxy-6-metoxy-1,4-benzoquinol methylase